MMTLLESVGPFYDRWLRLQGLAQQLEEGTDPRHEWLRRRLPDWDALEAKYTRKEKQLEGKSSIRQWLGMKWLDAKTYPKAYLMHKKENVVAELYGLQRRFERPAVRRRPAR